MNRNLPLINLLTVAKEQRNERAGCGRRRLSLCRSLKFLLSWCLIFLSIHADGQLTASFKASDTAGCVPFIVHFKNTSTSATSYSWDLGNGTTSSLTDVSGSFLTAGTYTVTLTSYSGSSSQTYSLIVRAYSAPVVNFTANKLAVCPGDPITFTSTSVPNCWGGLNYNWNFGDGGASTSNSPAYAYPSPGSYNVTLSAVNMAGCSSSLKKTGYTYVYTPAVVGFSVGTSFFCKAPATASFTNTSTGTGPLSYTWLFGDGGVSFATSPTHIYSGPGTPKTVTLKVADVDGCLDSLVQNDYITFGSLAAGFSSVSKACLYAPVTFNNTSSAHVSCKWYFGDGDTSIADTVVHAYLSTGIYTVKLVIKDGTCFDSVSRTITIDKPTGKFTISPACQPPVSITLTASVPPGATVAWTSFLHGSLGSGNSVSHLYPLYGFNAGGEVDAFTMYITDVNGCKDTVGKVLDTITSLFVGFNDLSDDKGCTPLTVHFNSTQTCAVFNPFGYFPPDNVVYFPYPHPVSTYTWDFADGSPVSHLANPSHTFTTAGVYPVKCTVTTTNGCTATGVDTIKTAIPSPVSSFTRTPSRVCAGQPMHFTSTSTGTINQYSWTFGDGGQATVPAPDHVYTVPGIFTTDLVTYNNGCGTVHYFAKDTVDSPSAVISYKYNCKPANSIAFADSSYGDNSHLWQFGDGTTSTAANPVHFYPSLIMYNVTLSTYNALSGCRDTMTSKLFLQRLTGNVTPDHASICRDAPDTVRTIINDVMDFLVPVTTATNCAWYVNRTFLDAHIPYFYDALHLTKMADSVFTTIHSTGSDTIAVVVTDNHGCLDTFSTRILVAKPIANFSFTPASGCAPLAVSFKDLSTDVPGAFPAKYAWTFGDGGVASVTSSPAVHIYTTSGSFAVKVIVTDNVGCSDTFNSGLRPTINKPTAGFSASTSSTCIGLNVSFNNLSTGGVSYFWRFGDGTTSTATAPTHSYLSPGVYDVTQVVTNSLGCKDTLTQTAFVTVNPAPKASFKMDDSFAVCPPLNVNFTNTSTGAISYQWTFGDGTNSINKDPGDIYTTSGLYRIKLQVVNSFGCTDTAIGHASIFGYSGGFSYNPTSVCESSPVHFKATLSGVTNILWDFSDGFISGVSLSDTISHRYTALGSYVPKLILTDSSGCSSVSIGTDTIKVDTLIPGFMIVPATACQNSVVSFYDTSISYRSGSTSWMWSFGSGATSTLKTPVYTYSVSGMQTVTLAVTNAAGCKGNVTKKIMVNPLPAPISGVANMCVGQPSTLSDATSGGTWSSANTTVATVDPVTGIVYGVSPATATIIYKLPTGCEVSTNATVNTVPTAIAGSTTVCEGFTTTLSDFTAGGTWSSANSAVASIGASSGILIGVFAGTTTITYKLSTGCSASTSVTIDPSPGIIIGLSNVCIGSAIVLSDVVGGGTWESSSTAIATIGSTSGVVTGVSSGMAAMIYSLGSGCTVSKIINVTPALPVITGATNVCIGFSTTLSDASLGGTWASSNTAIATVLYGVGKVTGVTSGTATISYTSVAGCIVTTTVTVDSLPPPINGNKQLCAGAVTTLSDAQLSGTWTIAGSTIATINSGTGVVTAIKAGTATITYTVASGCKITAPVTVNALPAAISGNSYVCNTLTTTLSDSSPGGVWSSSNTAVADIGSGSGVVTGMSAGSAAITYTLNTGCTAVKSMAVAPLQSPITGTPYVCAGNTVALSDTGSGVWISDNIVVADIGSSTGIVTGLQAGTATITYTISTGCRTSVVVTVNPLPDAVAGIADLCAGFTTTFSDATAGGMWSSDATAVATINSSSGLLTAVSAGTTTITYSLATGCIAAQTFTVNPMPLPIKGVMSVCEDLTIVLSDAFPGGMWLSGNTTVAVIGSASGLVTGKNAGIDTITYLLRTGCKVTGVVTVNPLPGAIDGTMHVCTGDMTTLSDVPAGGTWSSPDPVVSVGVTTGLIKGITDGTATLTYKLGTGCLAITSFTVNPMPSVITGITHVCVEAITVLSDSIAGGTWHSDNTSVALVDGSGLVTGVSVGTTTITYTAEGNCTAMTTVTIYPVLAPLVGRTVLCKGDTVHLSEIVPGGVWSSSDSSVATISGSGLLTGLTQGTASITYSLEKSCGSANAAVTVNPLPYAGSISGNLKICTGTATKLDNSVAGGRWINGDPSLSNIDSTGLLYGVHAGLDTVYYSYTNSCGTDKTNVVVAISQTPPGTRITTHPDTVLCANTQFQNFGADAPRPVGGYYVWAADNAVVYATGDDKQYCLITFNEPGTSVVKLYTKLSSSECISEDSIAFHIGKNESPEPTVVYYPPELVCRDNTAESFQWGYDDVKTLDSTILEDGLNQNYYLQHPDFAGKNYWVLTYHNGCLQKTYYNKPTGVNVNRQAGSLDINLYPNPAFDKVNIEVMGVDKRDVIGYTLYDVLGKERNYGNLAAGKGDISVHDLTPGFYMVLVTKDGIRIGTKTFVKK